MTVFQALSWEARDVDDEYLISIFGRTAEGKSMCVTTVFQPYFFIKLDKNATQPGVRALWSRLGDTPESYDIVKSKDLWGFQNNERFPFMKVNFTSLEKMRKCNAKLRYPLKGDSVPQKVFESNLDPVLRFMHRSGIQSTGWIDSGGSCVRANLTSCTIDLFCNDWKTLSPVTSDDVAPFVVASFDIETYSSTGKFPDANVPGDAVFQVAFTLKKLGSSEIHERVCFCYKETSQAPNGTVLSFPTEKDLLMAVQEYIIKSDFDALTGWNIFGFDLEYLFIRATINNCLEEFSQLGRIKYCKSEMSYKKLASSALGDNLLKLLPMPGRFIFDLFHEVKREHKLESYKLDYVSNHFLGDRKIDMSAKEMFRRFATGDPDQLGEVAEYCIKDTELPHMLVDKLCNMLNLMEMAKITWVPINYLVERGQQIKVFSQICRKAREKGFMVPTIQYGKVPHEQYEGATVLEAQIGAYYTPITALDFEGLYPSIMMAHNLCYSSLVLDPKYDNIPGVEYESFNIKSPSMDENGKQRIGENGEPVFNTNIYKFVQNVPSLIPEILSELKVARKQAKKDMANATGQMKAVYNGKQLAYKISGNSVYGFTGAGKGMLPCVPIAATVTFEGRHMIEQTKEKVEAEFPGAIVRYGDTDSVMVEFPLDGRTGEDALDYSWKLGEQAAEMCNGMFKKPKNLELEKVYWPYILYSKKRYAAKMWTQGRDGKMKMDCVDVKGLQLVRRDNTRHVRDVSREVLNIILESNNTQPAKELAHQRAVELLGGKVPMDQLVLSQSLAESYKNENLAHVRVRNKMREREPGSEPKPGDRVPYVLVRSNVKNATQGDRAEDPVWVSKHNLPLDYDYYFTNKFMTPVCDLLEPLVENPKETIFGDLLPKKKALGKKDASITDLFNKHKQKTLLNNKNNGSQ
jgi:DNA polymerase delta subunit 1